MNKKPAQRQRKARQQVSSAETWHALDAKLFRALSLDESESVEVEEQHSPNPVLSLQAFARGPREYLLYTTLQNLRKEAGIDSTFGSCSISFDFLSFESCDSYLRLAIMYQLMLEQTWKTQACSGFSVLVS